MKSGSSGSNWTQALSRIYSYRCSASSFYKTRTKNLSKTTNTKATAASGKHNAMQSFIIHTHTQHQLGHMQVYMLLHADNHAITPPLSFFYGVKALKAIQSTEANSFIIHVQKKLNTKYLTPGWVSTSECFFWYWLTRVVPDKWPLNGCCCCCTLHRRCITTLSYKNIRQLSAVSYILELKSCIQCFDAIGQLSGRAFML